MMLSMTDAVMLKKAPKGSWNAFNISLEMRIQHSGILKVIDENYATKPSCMI